MGFVLTIAEGKGVGRRFRFEAERITLGRGADSDVVLNDAGVSRAHARIERRGEAWVLVDADSVNGTELNGAPLETQRELHPGDLIGVGPVTFQFSAEGAAGKGAARGQKTRSSPLSPTARIAAAASAALLLICAARAVAPGSSVALSESEAGKEGPVGKVRVETLAVAGGDLAAAREAYERGRRKLEERRIAPRNLYDAWKAFTEARREMEGLGQKPALYGEVAQLIRAAARDLEKDCKRLLFSAARFTRYGQDDKAQQVFREVLLHFPGEDPAGCRKQAQDNLVAPDAAEEAER